MRAHTTALLALLRAPSSLTIYDGEVPDNPALPYAVLYPDAGTASVANLAAQSTWVSTVAQVTAVGLTRDQAEWAADKVSAALLDHVPTVTGRSANPVTQESAQIAQRDDSVTPHRFYAVTQWRVASVPA